MDASLSTGRSASLDSDGVMMIEKGQVTMVASGSISSLAMIESPDETEVRVLVVSTFTVVGRMHSPDDEYRTPG
jgi:hypothetical protein